MSMFSDLWEEYYRRKEVHWGGGPIPLPDLPKGARVLEIGCGTGNITLQALERGYDVTGIDLSRTAVQTARERASSRGFTPDLDVMDILMDDLPENEYDAVFLHHVLGSMWEEERSEAVKRSRFALRNGGDISFIDFSMNDMRFGKGQEVEKDTFLKGTGFIQHFFTEGEVRSLFSDMQIMRVEEINWEQNVGPETATRSRIFAHFRDQRLRT
ncbi:MAG: class I SAM-dependent methyltransferase [Candidatus Thermoplasmatota archaeon]|nr:class I SAM-dependent methyltransferase [Candidatus Thermoplasmatota archaeon]